MSITKKNLLQIIKKKRPFPTKCILSFNKINNTSYLTINSKTTIRSIVLPKTYIITPEKNLETNSINNNIFLIKYKNYLMFQNQIKFINFTNILNKTYPILSSHIKFYKLLKQTLSKNI